MSSALDGVLVAIAAVGTGIALFLRADLAAAATAAGVAVISASFLFAHTWSERADPRPRRLPPAWTDTDRFRSALRAGQIGRHDVVVTLHRLERRFRDPNVPMPTSEELAEVAALSPSEFRRYLRERLDRLEGAP